MLARWLKLQTIRRTHPNPFKGDSDTTGALILAPTKPGAQWCQSFEASVYWEHLHSSFGFGRKACQFTLAAPIWCRKAPFPVHNLIITPKQTLDQFSRLTRFSIGHTLKWYKVHVSPTLSLLVRSLRLRNAHVRHISPSRGRSTGGAKGNSR